MGKLTWDKIGKSSADNFSETIYRVRTVFPARGFTLSTYQIEELNGTQRPGKYDRNQLLGPLPNTTPGIVETDDDDDDGDDDDDDDDDGDQNNNAAQVAAANADPVLPRPRVANNTHRYEEGDTLSFTDPGWTHEPAIPGPRRSREGIITSAYTAQIAGQNALAYTVRFMLTNGRQISRDYEAKPLPRAQGGDPNEAIDTSPNVVYVHS